MGKLQTFEIVFHPAHGVFSAGATVVGYVLLELKETLRMRGIRMTVLGRACTLWQEIENVGHRGGRQRWDTEVYSAEEEYFNYRFKLWPENGQDDTDQSSLPAGLHKFPFQMQLPQDLPPSFEGAYGFIRYVAKASIDVPMKFDHHTKRAFTVISELDLNEEPNAAEPIRYYGELGTGCCCLPSGRFSGSLSTNHRGFVPGSEMALVSEVKNSTSSTCWADVKVKLIVTYLAGRKFKQEKKVVSSASKDGIPRGKSFTWRESLKIPSLPPSRLKGCKLIRTQYIVQFCVGSDANCTCDNIEFEDEIIVGTKPLAPSAATTPSDDESDVLPSAMVNLRIKLPKTDVVDTRRGEVPSPSPSSYEECLLFGRVSIKDKDDTDDTQGDLVFTPLYAFYSPPPREPEDDKNNG